MYVPFKVFDVRRKWPHKPAVYRRVLGRQRTIYLVAGGLGRGQKLSLYLFYFFASINIAKIKLVFIFHLRIIANVIFNSAFRGALVTGPDIALRVS